MASTGFASPGPPSIYPSKPACVDNIDYEGCRGDLCFEAGGACPWTCLCADGRAIRTVSCPLVVFRTIPPRQAKTKLLRCSQNAKLRGLCFRNVVGMCKKRTSSDDRTVSQWVREVLTEKVPEYFVQDFVLPSSPLSAAESYGLQLGLASVL